MKFCYWCNHYIGNGAFGGDCSLHDKRVLMWENCPDYDSENHEPGMCPTSRTCICTVYSHTCNGTMEEYLERKCGTPRDIHNLTDEQTEKIAQGLVALANHSYERLQEEIRNRIEEEKEKEE